MEKQRAKPINDHVYMICTMGPNRGKKVAVPIWLINDWMKGGYFSLEIPTGNRIGWDFADHASGVADVTTFNTDAAQRRAALSKTAADGPVPVDAGLADAMKNATNAQRVFSENAGPPPPPVDVAQAHSDIFPGPSGASDRGKPRDVI